MADYGSIADEEEVRVDWHRPLGVVVQVRFTEEEVRAIAGVAPGGRVVRYIKSCVLDSISLTEHPADR